MIVKYKSYGNYLKRVRKEEGSKIYKRGEKLFFRLLEYFRLRQRGYLNILFIIYLLMCIEKKK